MTSIFVAIGKIDNGTLTISFCVFGYEKLDHRPGQHIFGRLLNKTYFAAVWLYEGADGVFTEHIDENLQ